MTAATATCTACDGTGARPHEPRCTWCGGAGKVAAEIAELVGWGEGWVRTTQPDPTPRATPRGAPDPGCGWCHGRGWGLTTPHDTLEACDACGVYRTDEQAGEAARAWIAARSGVRPARYVELHVVIGRGVARLTAAAFWWSERAGWWASRLGADSGDEESAGDWIVTKRAPTRAEGLAELRALRELAVAEGFAWPLVRFKVEEVTFDTKRGDVLT